MDQKERRRFIRKEMQEFYNDSIFYNSYNAVQKDLFGKILDLYSKANLLLNVMYQDHQVKAQKDQKILNKMTA